jgi:hypothetical protein
MSPLGGFIFGVICSVAIWLLSAAVGRQKINPGYQPKSDGTIPKVPVGIGSNAVIPRHKYRDGENPR